MRKTPGVKLLNRILVATDFSIAGHRAITRAAQLAHQHEADLQLCHAAPDWNLFSRCTAAQKQLYDEVTLHAQSAMRDEVNRVLNQFGVHAQGEVQLGKASEVIARAIALYLPTIVVAGARGEHEPRIAPPALGGTALKLLLRMECPLLLVRGDDSLRYRTSLAAVQQPSDLSRRVILWSTALVPGDACHIVHAYDAPYSERMRLCGTSDAAVQACVLTAEEVARERFDTLLSAAVPDSHAHLHLVYGNPLGVLVTEIARHNPQLLVVGRRESERGQSPRESSGSTALRMAYHAPVDVLVVP
jgi:nucleotide-binding universal stress UspA family protein